jgi:signal transduction histidine kinase
MFLLPLIAIFAIRSDESAASLLMDENIKVKSSQAQKLVNDAIDYIKKQKDGIAPACKTFMSDPRWRKGEIFVWIFDSEGNCYCRGFEKECLWKNFGNKKGDDFIKRMEDAGKKGGFVDYKWNSGYSRAYVKNMKIGQKNFIVGAGLYPISSVYIVRELISSAVEYLKKTSFVELKERISNPTGIFVRGDIHLELYAFDGTCVAHGEQLALIGQNLIDAVTADNKFLIRDLIEIAKNKGEGWYDFRGQSGNEPARVFVKKIVDPADNKPYALVCGYYTEINDKTVMSLVKEASNFLKANGREIAFREFSTQNEKFVKGNVNIFVYDMKGTMVADSKNPAFVGLNLVNTRDSEGRFVARQILDMANTYGKGWVTNALSNSYQVAYCEKVKVPDGDFVIGAAYFPVSKESYVRFMLEDAVLYLQHHPLEESLLKFISKDGGFLRGDMNIFVYTMDGICLADGINLDKIWSNDLGVKDADGVKVIDRIIAVSKTGGGWLKFDLNQGVCNVYVKTVDKSTKDNKTEMYIVGSGYFE